jgi:hypothetical protein
VHDDYDMRGTVGALKLCDSVNVPLNRIVELLVREKIPPSKSHEHHDGGARASAAA